MYGISENLTAWKPQVPNICGAGQIYSMIKIIMSSQKKSNSWARTDPVTAAGTRGCVSHWDLHVRIPCKLRQYPGWEVLGHGRPWRASYHPPKFRRTYHTTEFREFRVRRLDKSHKTHLISWLHVSRPGTKSESRCSTHAIAIQWSGNQYFQIEHVISKWL